MKKRFHPFRIVGIFWTSFGAIVVFSALLVKDTASRVINLSAGLVLVLMGLLFFYFEKKFQ